MYTPNSVSVYTAAFSGAMAGMTITGRQPTDPTQTDYDFFSQVAGDFAQEMDTIYATGVTNSLDVQMIEQACAGYWAERQPNATQAFTVGEFTQACNAIIAALDSAVVYFAAQGIVPPTANGGWVSPTKQIISPQAGAILENDLPTPIITTNNTPATAFSFPMPDHTLLKMDVLVQARDITTGGIWATFNLSASFERNGAGPVEGGSTTSSDPKGSNAGAPPAGWGATIVASANNIIVQVTGDVADHVKWFVLPQTQTLA